MKQQISRSLHKVRTHSHFTNSTIVFAETLKITFVHDTPSVLNNTVRAEFSINRPVKKISCRIMGHSRKKDCKGNRYFSSMVENLYFHAGSDGRAVFQNIPKGTHKLQIVPENSREDKLNYKIKVYVSGIDSSSCVVNLINNRITHFSGNSVMIYFRGTNPDDQFKCSLNKRAAFRCKYVRQVCAT